jgi:hypothetical protein
MQLLNLKTTQTKSKSFKTNLTRNLLILVGLLILSGCGSCPKNNLVINSFKDRYYPLPKSKTVDDYLEKAPDELFNYIQINEITYQCEQEPTSELVIKCHNDFLSEE